MTKTLIFTGGHHTSALEVARAMRTLGWAVIWFGHRHTMLKDTADSAEYTEVTAQGLPFYAIAAGKFFHISHPLHLLRLPWGLIQTFITLLKLKRTHNIVGIVSFGGYLAVPTVLSGWLLGIPSLTHEQTLTAGWANRFVGHLCQKIAISWPQSAAYYPPNKVVLTGLPLRHELLTVTNKPANTIFVFCGKQGSHTINTVVFALLPTLLEKYTVIHQVGNSTLHHDIVQAQTIHHPNYHAFSYLSVDQVAHYYAQASVVVGRSGAHTTYELAYLNIRSVLIPLPHSSHAEQALQAQALVTAKLAICLPQSHLTPASLLTSIAQAQLLTPVQLNLISDGTHRLVQLILSTFA